MDEGDTVLHRQSVHGDGCGLQDLRRQLPGQFNLLCQLSGTGREVFHLFLHGHHTLVLIQVLAHLLGGVHLVRQG